MDRNVGICSRSGEGIQAIGRYFSAAEKYTSKYLAVLCLHRKKSHGKEKAVHSLALSHA